MFAQKPPRWRLVSCSASRGRRFRLDSAGINRRGVVNERNSESILTPEPCEGGGNAALKALDRGTCRLGIPEVDELRNSQNQMRRRCQANRKVTLWSAIYRQRD